jgi:hypothetical protein
LDPLADNGVSAIKFLIAGVYSNFITTIHDHGDMQQEGNYLAAPKGLFLNVKFSLLEQEQEME